MKINQLLEGDVAPQNWIETQYSELLGKYPVVSIPRFSIKFITDLPKTLTPAQLRQLINLSFNEDQIKEMLLPRDGGFRVLNNWDTKRWLENRIGRPDTNKVSMKWQEFVDKIKKDMDYDSDFNE